MTEKMQAYSAVLVRCCFNMIMSYTVNQLKIGKMVFNWLTVFRV
jgi:hypothetical protein